MDKPNASEIRRNVNLGDGEYADVHVRRTGNVIAWIGVYVRPRASVSGYWFTNLDNEAEALKAYWLAGAVAPVRACRV